MTVINSGVLKFELHTIVVRLYFTAPRLIYYFWYQTAPPTASAPGSPTADWHKEFVTEADAEILEHSGKIMLLFEILRMAEEVDDKV